MMISIIIPVHNVSEFICHCLESIANQTYKDLEVLLIDDCGKDDSVEKAQRFIDEYSGPILFRIIHHSHNKGVSAARNTGIAAAAGEFISFVDSDDYLDPDFCRVLLSYFQNGTPDVGVVACGMFKDSSGCIQDYYKVEGLHVITPDLYVTEMFVSGGAPFWAGGKMFRKEVLQNVKFRDGRRIEDTFFAFDAYPYIESKGISTLVIPEQLYYYRFHQTSYSNGDKIFLDALESYEEMLGMVDKGRTDLVLSLRTQYFDILVNAALAAKTSDSEKMSQAYSSLCNKLKGFDNGFAKRRLTNNRFYCFLALKYCPTLYGHLSRLRERLCVE